jgi:hypothetical protein
MNKVHIVYKWIDDTHKEIRGIFSSEISAIKCKRTLAYELQSKYKNPSYYQDYEGYFSIGEWVVRE